MKDTQGIETMPKILLEALGKLMHQVGEFAQKFEGMNLKVEGMDSEMELEGMQQQLGPDDAECE
jgi:hypothetical protein